MSKDLWVGIDLGTTVSAISYIDEHGEPVIIPNLNGNRTTPSVIFFEPGGEHIVGREAKNQAIVDPARTIRFVKREMGNPSYRFNVDGKDYFPETLSSLILSALKGDAERVLGQGISSAIVSVPAYFKDAQREATKNAAKIAGFERVKIVNEPTAAALTYGLGKLDQHQTVVIYDFGGGTFDVTVMRIDESGFTILGTGGDEKLGGKDIDELLVEYLAEQFLKEHDIDLRDEPHTRHDLWDKAEQLKKDLSFRTSLAVVLSVGNTTSRIDIDREKFDSLISDITARTRECMTETLQATGLGWSDIDAIVLAGGSSRIPAIREMIKECSGVTVMQDMNPDECVAKGAAIQGAMLVSDNVSGKTDSGPERRVAVQDITPHSLGIKVFSQEKDEYVNSIIIPRFAQIPCVRTRKYRTQVDNQKKIEFDVLQGEDADPQSPGNQLLGKAGLSDLPDHKAGELVINVTLSYNSDGIVEVSTHELKGGRTSEEVLMKKHNALSDEEIERFKDDLNTGDV